MTRRPRLRADRPDGHSGKTGARQSRRSFDLIVSPLLLEELDLVLRRETLRRYASLTLVDRYLGLLRREGVMAVDPAAPPPIRCADPDDDYLIALAHDCNAALV